ncbi:hypothetical protein KP79_PYT22115 [Mizuhopecten yessoensis]|uniref:ZP domain-containing protein n=1 Tax=Mizuhopecten yessoensis TaxID=6573 RepID=A0A210R4G0_MIZYE|nr:hypothetical protein KP79_PYT22115 [Mizuhopecten yessoensis]
MNDENSLANVKINYLNNSASNCSDPKTEDDGSIAIATCKMNTTVTIVLEAENTTGILGGRHSKTFQIKCDEVNIQPYLLNVTVKENVGKKATPNVITMATEPSPYPISSLTMTIKDKNNTATEAASIGQVLTVAIIIPDKSNIKPTECKASGNGKSVTLWQEKGCKHDDELFGVNWRKDLKEVTNTMYAFRFVGSSTSINITCIVRVCPNGYMGHDCDLSTCESKKRKRSTALLETVTIQKATTSLTIRAPLMTSRAGRK